MSTARIAITASHFCVDYIGITANMLYPILAVSLGLSLSQVGIAAGTTIAVNGTSNLFFGLLSDRVSFRPIIVGGIVLQGTMIALLARSPSYTWMMVILVGLGVGSGAYHPVAIAIANKIVARGKGVSLGVFFLAGNMGMAVSPAVAGLVLYSSDFVGSQYTSVLTIVSIVIAAGLLLAVRGTEIEFHSSTGEANVSHDWYNLFMLGLVILMRGLAFGGALVFLPFLYHAVEQPSVAGLALAFFVGGFALGTFAGGALSDFAEVKLLVVCAFVFAAPFLLLAAWIPGSGLSIAAGCIAGLAMGASQTPTVLAVQNNLPKFIGTASGLGIGATFVSQGLGGVVTGFLSESFGVFFALVVLAMFLVAGLITSIILPEAIWDAGNS
tara:strand:- start:387 stop:1535 length:1149 start_codon:yes stop_codon:yes gene_type:complete